jgi:RimJ/RimL family protein N-acetyltransferase
MTDSKTVSAPRLRLEPFAERHLHERYVAWLNDREVVRFSENRHDRHDLDSCRSYVRSFAGTPHLLFAIVAHDPQLGHIGNLSAHRDERHGRADLAILLGERSAWGKGLGTEAWLALCDHLIRGLGVRKLTAGTIAPNLAMRRIAEKAGMSPDGVQARHLLWEGGAVDVHLYALFAEAWLERHPRGPFEGRASSSAQEE